MPLHIWAERDRIITLRDKRLFLTALRDIRQAIDRGKGPRRSGELLVQIADKVVRDLEPLLDDMDEEVDRLEDQLFDSDVGIVKLLGGSRGLGELAGAQRVLRAMRLA